MNKNNIRILRNTGMLYMRMLLAMAVGLYTSRVLLDVLGVEDFGIYHVVAGFVALLGFMQGAMVTATQRYFAFDIGENNGSNLCSLFNTSLQVHALLTFGIVVIAETLGLWFVSTQLTIDSERIAAALLAYHYSVAAFAISVMTVPLTAMLMANERMGLFALMSMADVLMKLLAVLLLPYFASDQLSMYAALLLSVSLISFSGYSLINRAVFPVVRFQLAWNPERFRSMLGFTAWNTWGNLAAAMSEHGNNVLLNIFFGPLVNAGRSIASQANGALNNFVVNVQAAVNPQIVKQYAGSDTKAMQNLVLLSAKYNFFILFTLALPVLLNTEELLSLWLVEVPPYTSIFLQLTIVVSLINSISGPLMTSAQATGHIRLYHTVVGSILLLNVPVGYYFLSKGYPPETILAVTMGLSGAALIARLCIIAPLIRLPIKDFFSHVVRKIAVVSLVAGCVGYIVHLDKTSSLIYLSMNVLSASLVSVLIIFLLGLIKSERQQVVKFLKSLKMRIL